VLQYAAQSPAADDLPPEVRCVSLPETGMNIEFPPGYEPEALSVNRHFDRESGYEEGYDRGAFQKVTELITRQLTPRPRERALAGFVLFRQCW